MCSDELAAVTETEHQGLYDDADVRGERNRKKRGNPAATETRRRTDVDRPMSAKEAAFVHEYLRNGFNASEAVKAAGYRCGTEGAKRAQASKLLTRGNVAKALEEQAQHAIERAEVDQAWVIRMLRDNVSKAKAAGDYKAANRSLELLGEHLRMWGRGTKHVVVKDVRAYTDAEMLETIRQLDDMIRAQGGTPPDLVLPPIRDGGGNT